MPRMHSGELGRTPVLGVQTQQVNLCCLTVMLAPFQDWFLRVSYISHVVCALSLTHSLLLTPPSTIRSGIYVASVTTTVQRQLCSLRHPVSTHTPPAASDNPPSEDPPFLLLNTPTAKSPSQPLAHSLLYPLFSSSSSLTPHATRILVLPG